MVGSMESRDDRQADLDVIRTIKRD